MKISTDYLGKYSVSCPRTDQCTLCQAGNSPLVETNGGLGRVAGAAKEGNMWTGKHLTLDHHVASLRKHLHREGKHQAQQLVARPKERGNILHLIKMKNDDIHSIIG